MDKTRACIITFFLFSTMISTLVNGQTGYLETGILAGTTAYSGEISTRNGIWGSGNFHPAGGVFLRYQMATHWAMRASLLQGTISGDDAQSDDPGHVMRNLSFASPLREAGLQLEYQLSGLSPANQFLFTPYVSAGVAVFGFNPKTRYAGQWVDLQPLGTEGQGSEAYPERRPYALTGVSFPLSAGIRIALTPRLTLGAEVGIRYTLTDYLDDVSTTYPTLLYTEGGSSLTTALSNRMLIPKTFEPGKSYSRGNPDSQDWYYFTGFSLSYRLSGTSAGPTAFGNKGVKCYHF